MIYEEQIKEVELKLSDVQQATVDYLYHRMYEEGQGRMLVADEVGLGKTWIAKGLIAKAFYRWQKSRCQEKKRFNVFYICSNQQLAAQNLKKVNFTKDKRCIVSQVNRISLLAYKPNNEDVKFCIYSLTPDTSFNEASTLGIKEERLMLYAILETDEEIKKLVQDPEEFTRVVHILIPYECKTEITDSSVLDGYEDLDLSAKMSAKQSAFAALSEEDQEAKKAEAKKLAEEVLEKAKNGDDFATLIKEYGWDPGMEAQPDGYYVNKNTSFVEAFKKAAFELKENEISGLVEDEKYGWFIIKRLPVDMDYVEENMATIRDEYDTPRINQLYEATAKKMEIVYSDIYEKITIDSIK